MPPKRKTEKIPDSSKERVRGGAIAGDLEVQPFRVSGVFSLEFPPDDPDETAPIHCDPFRSFHSFRRDLRGGDAATNAAILEAILAGQETGPRRDMVVLNAAAALACAGLADHIGDAIDLARAVLDDGAALEKLRLLRKASNP